MTRKLPPLHPSEILREEFLAPLGMSAGALAKVCGVPRTRIERIVSEDTGISAGHRAPTGQGFRHLAGAVAHSAK